MPKAKTRKAAAKRFRVTGTGKIVRGRSGGKHLLEWKTSSKKRRLGKHLVLDKAMRSNTQKMLPYAR